MIKDRLREKEPVVYQSLLNALNKQQLAQCFLLAGPKNPLKLDTAFLLAQTIVEGGKDFACETCNTCRRIKDNNYYDLIFIDGYADQIKTEDIDHLLSEFAKTPLEAPGKQIYIISNINNAHPKALNAILKFMEEPASENIYGILITDQIDSLLPTIVSRCQTFTFRALNVAELAENYVKKGFEPLDAYLVANIFKQDVDIQPDDQYYLHAKDTVLATLNMLDEPMKIALYFDENGYSAYKKDSDGLKQYMRYYLSLMVTYCNDALNSEHFNDLSYSQELHKLAKYPIYNLLNAFVETLDKCNAHTNFDKRLLFDQLAYRLTKIL